MIEMKERPFTLSGTTKLIRPIFIEKSIGNGKQWVKIRPIHNEHLFFVIRIDSSTELTSDHFPENLERWESIFGIIEKEFGPFKKGIFSWGVFPRECVHCSKKLDRDYQPETFQCVGNNFSG